MAITALVIRLSNVLRLHQVLGQQHLLDRAGVHLAYARARASS